MSTPSRATLPHEQPIDRQILQELKSLREAVEKIARALAELSKKLPNAG